jgi:hypothetical protein
VSEWGFLLGLNKRGLLRESCRAGEMILEMGSSMGGIRKSLMK